MGSGVGSIESAMERIFREAEHEILITVYAISNATDLILEWIENALARGVLIRILVNRLESQPAGVATRLKQLAQIYPHFHLLSFQGDEEHDLHAKTIVADRRLALVGSSNLSHRGMITNHELAVLIEGDAAQNIASTLDKLFESGFISR